MPPGDRTLKEYSISNSSFFYSKEMHNMYTLPILSKSIRGRHCDNAVYMYPYVLRHFKTHIFRHTEK